MSKLIFLFNRGNLFSNHYNKTIIQKAKYRQNRLSQKFLQSLMKAVSKDKIQKGLKFIQDLRANERIVPFLDPQQMQRLGLYDFKFVVRKTTKLQLIEQKIKQNKYNDLDELISELKLVFEMIGYYVPLTDPLQNQVKYFINQVQKWRSQPQGFVAQQPQTRLSQKTKPAEPTSRQTFNKNQKHYQSQRQKKIKNYATLQEQKQKINQVTKAYKLPVRSSLAQKLQMIYFLKAHQTNQPFIHMIGDQYGIGKETDDEYVIKLDNSTCCSWLEVLQNNNGLGQNQMQPQ